jgi:hypothetical protein
MTEVLERFFFFGFISCIQTNAKNTYDLDLSWLCFSSRIFLSFVSKI